MIRIAVADSQHLVRRGVVYMLRNITQVHVVGEAASGEEAVQLARELHPDIVLMEVMLPGMGGLEATQRITALDKLTSVIALTTCAQPPFPAQMLKAGASGFLTKNVQPEELEQAIRRVFLGKRYVCHEVAQDLAGYVLRDHSASPFDALSHREMQITIMVVNCQRVRDISCNLHLSPKTVNSYRYRIFEKLKVNSDVELALLAVKHGMVTSAVPLPASRTVNGSGNSADSLSLSG